MSSVTETITRQNALSYSANADSYKHMIYNVVGNRSFEATPSKRRMNDKAVRVSIVKLGDSSRVGVTKFLNEYPRYVAINLKPYETATLKILDVAKRNFWQSTNC
jgi:hypothetical protein